MPGVEESEQRVTLAELQRRLYRPGASDADREHYVALRDELARAEAAVPMRTAAAPAQAAPEDAPPAAPPLASSPAAHPARRRLLLIGGLLVGVIAAASAVALAQQGRDGADPVARPTAGSSGTSRRLSGDTAWTASPVPHPTTVEVAVDDARVLGQRFSGSGTTTVPLITGSAPLDGGHLAVVLASPDSPVGWRAEGGAGRAADRVVVTSTPYFGLAAPVPDVRPYREAPPARIVVQAPAGTAWTMTVAFTR